MYFDFSNQNTVNYHEDRKMLRYEISTVRNYEDEKILHLSFEWSSCIAIVKELWTSIILFDTWTEAVENQENYLFTRDRSWTNEIRPFMKPMS